VSGPSSVQVSIYGGDDAYLRCFSYDDRCPILHISGGSSIVTVSPAGHLAADDEDLKFARELLRTVREFAAEVERLHGAPATSASDDGGGAAGEAA
jgi:hypothetical protein